MGQTQVEHRDVPSKLTQKLPKPHGQPSGSYLDGKCGVTAAANLLKLYGKNHSPSDLDTFDNRSWGPGMRADKLAEVTTDHADQTFLSLTIPPGVDALKVLRGLVNSGKPVAIQYLVYEELSTNAHWVVVTDIDNSKDPKIRMMSWGKYIEMEWSVLKDQWERAWGGPYPYVVGEEPSSLMTSNGKAN